MKLTSLWGSSVNLISKEQSANTRSVQLLGFLGSHNSICFRNIIPIVLMLGTFLSACFVAAAETVSLAKYLELAEAAGIHTLYSTDLVPRYYNVTYDPESVVTLAKVEKALAGFNLTLRKLNDTTYAVVKRVQQEEQDSTSLKTAATGRFEIEEIVVTSSRYKLVVQRELGSTTLSHLDLITRPAVGNDAARLVSNLPGSASIGISARPRVRGGLQDETLIQFDGVRLYEPFHFQNFNQLFGSFDARIIEDIDFSSGGFSARDGDRLSAVMDISPRDTQDLIPTREIGLGFFNASYLHAGGNSEHDWLIDLRKSTTEYIAGLSEQDLGKPSFADVFARYRWNLQGKHRLSASLFWFGDDMHLRNTSGTEVASNIYGNTYFWLKAESELSSRLNATSLVSFSGIKNDRTGIVNKPELVVGNLDDDREFRVYNLKQQFEYLTNENLLFEFGWDYRYLDARYQFDSNLLIDPVFQGISNFNRPAAYTLEVLETGHQYATYLNSKWSPLDKWVITFGVRVDGQHYEHSLKELQISPRLGLLFRPARATTLRASWGKYSQADGVHELKINDGIEHFQPIQKNEQFIIGLEQSLPGDFSFRIEAYKKYGLAVNPYYVNLSSSLTLLPELQFDRYRVIPEDYDSRGLEMSLEGQIKGIDVWANYSISQTEDTIGGQKIKRSWDQTHAGNYGVAMHYHDWQISLAGSFHDGWLTTPFRQENGVITADSRNSISLGDYQNIDLKVTREWAFETQQLRLEAGITNLLNRENQVGTEYEVKDGVLQSRDKFGLPLLPFLDFYWNF